MPKIIISKEATYGVYLGDLLLPVLAAWHSHVASEALKRYSLVSWEMLHDAHS